MVFSHNSKAERLLALAPCFSATLTFVPDSDSDGLEASIILIFRMEVLFAPTPPPPLFFR